MHILGDLIQYQNAAFKKVPPAEMAHPACAKSFTYLGRPGRRMNFKHAVSVPVCGCRRGWLGSWRLSQTGEPTSGVRLTRLELR